MKQLVIAGGLLYLAYHLTKEDKDGSHVVGKNPNMVSVKTFIDKSVVKAPVVQYKK